MIKKKGLILLKILFLLFVIEFYTFNSVLAETTDAEFESWLVSYKKFALSKGISKETIKIAFKDVKFLEQVIKYDRKQPEFYEDTVIKELTNLESMLPKKTSLKIKIYLVKLKINLTLKRKFC